MPDDTDMLLQFERRRCEAIARGDRATLESLLSDDYVHVHMTGKVDDRQGHIDAVVARPRTPERGELLVRVYGNLAVLTGDLTNIAAPADGTAPRSVQAVCQQVAVKGEGGWRFVSCQLTPKPSDR